MDSFPRPEKECLIPFWKQNQKNLPNSRVCYFKVLKEKPTLLGYASFFISTITPWQSGFHRQLTKLLRVRLLKDHYLPKLIGAFASFDVSATFDPGYSIPETPFLGFLTLFSHCVSLTALSAPLPAP